MERMLESGWSIFNAALLLGIMYMIIRICKRIHK